MYHLIGFIYFGTVAGIFAFLMSQPLNQPYRGGKAGAAVGYGIAGAMAVGWLGRLLGWYHADDGSAFIAATVGAALTLMVCYSNPPKRRVYHPRREPVQSTHPHAHSPHRKHAA